MGNISSRYDDTPSIFLKDQTRFALKSLVISNGRRRVVLNITPNGVPATRLLTKREAYDDTPISFIQEADASNPPLLLQIELEDELDFRFTFVTKQTAVSPPPNTTGASTTPTDTTISGLTFAYAPSTRELDTLVTREFHADPNLHKNSNVQFIGDFGTNGVSSIEYEWSWRWRPPRPNEDKGGGWRNTCSFLEYDSRAHRLNTLASFAFWVRNSTSSAHTPIASPRIELAITPMRHRMPSSQSYQSQVSDSEGPEPLPSTSPLAKLDSTPSVVVAQTLAPTPAPAPVPAPIDVACQRPAEDVGVSDDGPVFRATIKSLEQKTGNMRIQIKKVLKKAEAAQLAQIECNEAMNGFLTALHEASSSNASAFKPALDHYFTKTAKKILQYEHEQGNLLRRQILDPLSKLYNVDIKQADTKKKDFEDESRDYYAYVSRYLGQRQDSMKDKKRAESDSKYQAKKRNFELARFDYSAFMQDLHGGRKEQELLSQLTKYADGQTKAFLKTAKAIENFGPQLEALLREVADADKEYQLQRTEREEKRRNLEMNTVSAPTDAEVISQVSSHPSSTIQPSNQGGYISDTDLSRADSTSSQFGYGAGKSLSPMNSVSRPSVNGTLSSSPGPINAMNPNKFRGIRDLEERDMGSPATVERQNSAQHRKEGLLWALSKPGSHIDPKGINKQAWHKFWIVLDQGKLSEYNNWKDKLDLHRDPIDLRMASVRMARDAERRFCFEVITPQYKRVYQATTEDEMNNWISAINNALQSAFEGRNGPSTASTTRHESTKSEYGAVLVGKRLSQSGQHGMGQRNDSGVNRSSTVGSRPSASRTVSANVDINPTKLLDQLRANDQGNQFCADCGSNSRVEWTSLNLGIILCIECGGIHRSLGTHISKVRSLTLDSHSYTNDVIELLMQIGNRISNMVWEAQLGELPGRTKPEPWAKREDRLRYITAKYVDRAFIDPAAAAALGFVNIDDTLLTSIKRNDIQGVLTAIAHRANVNAHDRSRNTHAVHLALIAADPARPVSPAPPEIARKPLPGTAVTAAGTIAVPTPSTATTTVKKVTFPIAELLIQNGADIPVGVPLFPLSSAALAYLETRRVR